MQTQCMIISAQQHNWSELQRLFRLSKQSANPESACLHVHCALQEYPDGNVFTNFKPHPNIIWYVRTVMHKRVTQLYNLYEGSYNDIPVTEINLFDFNFAF